MDNLAIWIYSIVGTLFMFYTFFIFIQKCINNKLRLTLSGSFLIIGLFFFNLAGDLITGYEGFTTFAIMNAIMLAALGSICVYYVFKENSKRNKASK